MQTADHAACCRVSLTSHRCIWKPLQVHGVCSDPGLGASPGLVGAGRCRADLTPSGLSAACEAGLGGPGVNSQSLLCWGGPGGTPFLLPGRSRG